MAQKLWGKMSIDEKLAALHTDVNDALDAIDQIKTKEQKTEGKIKQFDEALHLVGKQLFELRVKLQKKFPTDSF